MESFEKLVQVCVCEVGREVLDIVFQAVDARLMSEKGSNLAVVGFRERTTATVFGEMKLRRSLYRNKVTGETGFLLDERLGLEERARVSPGLKKMVVNLAMQLSFRKVAEVLTEMTPGLSPMAAWGIAAS